LSRRGFSIRINENQRTRLYLPQPERLDFARLAQSAKVFADYQLSKLVGEAREEVEAGLDLIHELIDGCEVRTRRLPSTLAEHTEETIRTIDEIIPYLHRYGIEDTKPLENIRDELDVWLEKQQRRQGPLPPSM